MMTQTRLYRYQLPKKAIKSDCPQCGPRHHKTLSRYIDTRTGETLPEVYGRCDRESNCGYSLGPYTKGPSGLSYAEEVNPISSLPREWFKRAAQWKRRLTKRKSVVTKLMQQEGTTREQAERVANYVFDQPARPTQLPQATPLYYIPDQIFTQSVGHYDQNQFARLLIRQFGQTKADELLNRFHIGTSARWPGACVFWLIDEQSRPRAGQVVLFADNWHKAWYTTREGIQKICISSVSHGLLRRYRQKGEIAPDWLTDYHQHAPRWPFLFGLHQLAGVPTHQPVAIVEAPKTAVICSALMPNFIWLAAGSLSYLNSEKLACLHKRPIRLFPDLSREGKAFTQWSKVADQMNARGYQVSVSNLLEQKATDEQRANGLDLADFLLMPASTQPRWVLDGRTIEGEVLACELSDRYPSDWDTAKDNTPPILIPSPNQAEFARVLGIPANKLPLYRQSNRQ